MHQEHVKPLLIYGGAAVNEVLRLVWWARPLTYLYQLPGIRQLEDKLYRWVAGNRYRLPGGTASCAIDSKGEEKAGWKR